MKVRNYQDLIAWQRSMDFVEEIYSSTRIFPREEIYSLTNHLRRAAVTIASNIAEGQGRQSTADFCRHLSIAYGSLREAETQILIAQRLGYLSATTTSHLIQIAGEIGRLLNGLMASLRK